jgi:hypothetical protein
VRGEIPKWHDANAKDNPPFLDALAKSPEHRCERRVVAITTSRQSSWQLTSMPKPPRATGSISRTGRIASEGIEVR